MSDSTSRTKSVAENVPATSENGVSGLTKQPSESSQYVAAVDRTVIAQSPIAGLGEFYPTGTVATLARVLIGQQLDHYQLHELVGGGGMGAVFRASDTRLDRIVAVKVIPSLGRDLETLKRFRIEAQSAAKLDHPHIARVYYVGETEAWSYIVFEYVEGTNLRDLVVRQGPLSIDDAVCYTCQVAEALQHAADRLVVHRDIKPSNVLVTADGIIKVVDMGLARTTAMDRSTNDLTASGVTLGTFDYISPEQARDPRAADVRSDLYSLGCTLYYMLTGRPPYPDGTAMQKLLMHGSVQADDPRNFRDDISADLSAIIQKLMAKKPDERYQQPVDLIADLQCLADLENLTKSRHAVGIVVAPLTNERTFLEIAMPWLMGALAVLGSTWYLHSQYSVSAAFIIPPSETETRSSVEELDGKDTKVEIALAPYLENPLKMDKTIDFAATESGEAIAMTESFTGPTIPKADALEMLNGNATRASSIGSLSLTGNHLLLQNSKSRPFASETTKSKVRALWVRPFESTDPVADHGSEYRVITGNLADAMALADSESEIDEIVLDDDVWILDRTLSIKRSSLAIRSAPDRKARIEVRIPRQVMSSMEGNTVNDRIVGIDVGSSQFILNDLDLYTVSPDSGSGSLCLIGLAPGGSVRVMRSTITMSSNGGTWKTSSIGATRAVPTISQAASRAIREPLQIFFEDVIVRGEGDLVALEPAQRTEFRWQNGLVAVGGRMFEIAGARESSRTPPTIRVDLEQVTVAARQGFARIRLSKEYPHPVCLSRDSKNCVYSSDSGYPLTAIENVDLGDPKEIDRTISAWLDLRGRDNAYDEQIDTLLKWTSPKGTPSKIAFQSASQDYFSERAPETSIRWSNPRPVEKPFERQTAGDYLQREGNFRPGFKPELLPNH